MGELKHACEHVTTRKFDGEDAADFIIDVMTSLCPECQQLLDDYMEKKMISSIEEHDKCSRTCHNCSCSD